MRQNCIQHRFGISFISGSKDPKGIQMNRYRCEMNQERPPKSCMTENEKYPEQNRSKS